MTLGRNYSAYFIEDVVVNKGEINLNKDKSNNGNYNGK